MPLSATPHIFNCASTLYGLDQWECFGWNEAGKQQTLCSRITQSVDVFRSHSEPVGSKRISHAPAPVGAALLLPVQLQRTLVTAARRGCSSTHYRRRETGSAKVFTHASTCTRWLVQTPLFFLNTGWTNATYASQSHVSPTHSPGVSLRSCSRGQRCPSGPMRPLEAVLASCISLNVFTKEQFTADKRSITLWCKCKDRECFWRTLTTMATQGHEN